jgi:hypothetical protein
MNTAKVYKDIDDNECTIHQMVNREPQWAATRIQVGEDALEMLALIKEWDIEQFKGKGKFTLPLKLREKMYSLRA